MLQKYTQLFTDKQVDMDTLNLMSDEDLHQLGVTALGMCPPPPPTSVLVLALAQQLFRTHACPFLVRFLRQGRARRWSTHSQLLPREMITMPRPQSACARSCQVFCPRPRPLVIDLIAGSRVALGTEHVHGL